MCNSTLTYRTNYFHDAFVHRKHRSAVSHHNIHTHTLNFHSSLLVRECNKLVHTYVIIIIIYYVRRTRTRESRGARVYTGTIYNYFYSIPGEGWVVGVNRNFPIWNDETFFFKTLRFFFFFEEIFTICTYYSIIYVRVKILIHTRPDDANADRAAD